MKKLIFAIALFALAIGGSAFAQISSSDNNIGVYFDAAGTVSTNNDGIIGMKHVYLVLTNLTSPTVDGVECKITSDAGMIVGLGSLTFPVNAINIGYREGEIIAGFATPVPAVGGVATVAQFDILVTNPAIPGAMFLDPVYFASLPGTAAYVCGNELFAANNVAAPGLPVLLTNSPEEVVATEAMSFDNLKSLYR